MEFRTRSKENVLADLTGKLRVLPIDHPDRAVLTRMIRDLGRELGIEPDRAAEAVPPRPL
jgi:hypothetical protein